MRSRRGACTLRSQGPIAHCGSCKDLRLTALRSDRTGTYLKLSPFLSKTVADCLKLSQSSKIVAMCLNLSLILSHVPAPKAHTSQGTIHGYVHSWNDPAQPDPDPPDPLQQHHQARSCLPSQLHPASHARRPCQPPAARGAPPRPCPPSLQTWPSVPPDPASRSRPAMPADPASHACPPSQPSPVLPSRADQQGHICCFCSYAVDQASLVSSSFLLISAS